ncbi:MAG: cyclopropane fatty-acyl-phospholipid synthase-like methyltransferase [Saprospiraceae bacterium]|jgi:cyclopropane fatty-acyl-phospholipid synthase-like methyltransferase
MDLPFSQACENNKHAILAVLRPLMDSVSKVLEVGSGTGQHAAHFADALPNLTWQTSDVLQNHAGIQAWIDHSSLSNIASPVELDVRNFDWAAQSFQAIYSANAIHIMSWAAAQQFIVGAATALEVGGLYILYGPFNYEGQYTSASNKKFDQWLAAQNKDSAIREFEAVSALAEQSSLKLVRDTAMPANNRLIVWRKAK